MILLGSTGSIGVNTLKVAEEFNIDVDVLTAGNNIELLNKQIEKFKPKYVVISNKDDINLVKSKNVYYGEDGVLEALNLSDSKKVINAISGFAGIKASLETQKLNKSLLLANKESLVIAGKFLNTEDIFPIDSEHYSLKYLVEHNKDKFEKLIITASGGSIRDLGANDIRNLTVKEVLNHPNWNMGKKITVDSASMVNKLFEVLEAYHLFNTKNVDALIERSSNIHALVRYKDGSISAHIANNDMKIPISASLGLEYNKDPADIENLLNIDFREIDTQKYPLWGFKDEILKNPDLGLVLNTSSEKYVYDFLANRIGFLDMIRLIEKVLQKFISLEISNVSDIFEIDSEIKRFIELDKESHI